nr:uncharacterized mitochondrial protein AtMg00810-like [Tanacetum cinerariifolium]
MNSPTIRSPSRPSTPTRRSLTPSLSTSTTSSASAGRALSLTSRTAWSNYRPISAGRSRPVSSTTAKGGFRRNISKKSLYMAIKHMRTGKKITINGSDTTGYDKKKVECFNCHKMGHFSRECRSPRNQESKPSNQDSSRKNVNVEDTSSKAMVAINEAGFDYSYMADDEVSTNVALMAFSDSELHNIKTCSNTCLKSRTCLGFASYHAVSPPHIGLFAPPTIDLSNSGFEEFQHLEFEGYGPKTNMSVCVDTSNKIKKAHDAPIIKDWVSDSDEDEYEVMKEFYSNSSFNQVWNSTNRQSSSRAATPVSAARPIATAAPKPLVNVAKTRKKAFQKSHSLSRRPFYQQTALKNRNLNDKINTAKVNSVNTAKVNRVTSAVRKQGINAVKSSACWVWRPKIKGDPQDALKDTRIFDSSSKESKITGKGKFDGKANKGFLVGYSINSKAFKVYNSITRKVEGNLHVKFLKNKPNVVGSGPEWLFDIDSPINLMNYQPINAGNRTNGNADDVGKKSTAEPKCVERGKMDDLRYLDEQMKSTDDSENTDSTNSFNTASLTVNVVSTKDGNFQRTYDIRILDDAYDDRDEGAEVDYNNLETMEPKKVTHALDDESLVEQRKDGIFLSQDKYVCDILKKFGFSSVKSASTLMETHKPLSKDENETNVDVHLYRYLKGQPTLGLWYLKDSPLELIAYSESDYAGASLDRKSTTGGFQFLGIVVYSQVMKGNNVAKFLPTTRLSSYDWIQLCTASTKLSAARLELKGYLLTDGYADLVNMLVTELILLVFSILDFINTTNGHQFTMSNRQERIGYSRANNNYSKTINSVKQIHAIVDGKAVVISESSMRSDILFDDEDGITCLTNDEIFKNLALMGCEPLSTNLTFQKGGSPRHQETMGGTSAQT